MSKTVIKIENLSKIYRLGEVGTGTLSHDLNRFWKMNILGQDDPYAKIGQVNDRTAKAHKGEMVAALRDINLEVKEGEVLGIIGRNGAGKSTLLKILSRVTSPTTGSIRVKGRMASLLEVGTGFHPEMTGRENIYMNGTIMGMRRWEIDRKLDEIVEFAGVAKYLDTPTKRYSSGMTVRLGFAIAAHLEPEILVVDEVLAVGDAEFQKKAIGKMQDVSTNEGRTVLFVSHNMGAVNQLCNRGIIIEQGCISYDGLTSDAVQMYYNSNQGVNLADLTFRKGNLVSKLIQVEAYSLNASNNEKITPVVGQSLFLRFEFDRIDEFRKEEIQFDFRIENKFGTRISWLSTSLFEQFSIEHNSIVFEIEKCPLNVGPYFVSTCLTIQNNVSDWIQNAFKFDVEEGAFYQSAKLPPSVQCDVLLNCKTI